MASDQGAVSQAALNRLELQAASQEGSASRQLALTPYEYGDQPAGINPPTNPTPQDQSAQVQRLSTGQWSDYTGQLNHAQAAQPGSAVWVTVPVDKVVTSGGNSSVTPVYASTKGYVPRPGESRGSIPPPMPAGRPI